MVSEMAKAKRKPAPAAKKKKAAKAKPTKSVVKKPATKKAPAKAARKPTVSKVPARKVHKRVASRPVAKKPARHAVKKPVAKTKPGSAKPAAKSAATSSSANKSKKPVVSATPVKPKQSAASSKSKMATAVSAGSETVTREDGRYALPSNVVIDLPANYRPGARGEEYMGPRQLAYFRAKLLKWREDLVEESKQTIDNLRDEVRDVGDEAERATRETENSLELRTRDRYRKLIGKIDKALKRIEEGRYGFCEETDEDIGVERLEARPIATLCLDAQERWEHRQKQMGD